MWFLHIFQVKDTSIHQRKCLFSSDLQLDAYRHYSYSACDVQCRQKAQLKVCNCNHHLMPEACMLPLDLFIIELKYSICSTKSLLQLNWFILFEQT